MAPEQDPSETEKYLGLPSPEIYADDPESEATTLMEDSEDRSHSSEKPKAHYTNSAFGYIEKVETYVESTEWGQRTTEAWRRTPRSSIYRILIIFAVFLILIITLTSMTTPPSTIRQYTSKNKPAIVTSVNGNILTKPKDTPIIAMVTYGRRSRVSILDCYLRKNLVRNGGWLDEIYFFINTNDAEDLAWIEALTPQVPEYRKVYIDKSKIGGDFFRFYHLLANSVPSESIIIKIDDDLIWLHDHAIPELVTTLATHPEAFSVLGNIVNAAATNWVDHHTGSSLSYLPEPQPPSGSVDPESWGPKAWRASKLPTYKSPSGGSDIPNYEFSDAERDLHGPPSNPQYGIYGKKGTAPYKYHRWLPLREPHNKLMHKTPLWGTQYDPFGNDLWHWQLAAQKHYTFLQHLEEYHFPVAPTPVTVAGRTHTPTATSLPTPNPAAFKSYHFGAKDGLWNLRYMRGNINLMAVWAKDIIEHVPNGKGDDEESFSVTIPKLLKRECYVQTLAQASHYRFWSQFLMNETDVLGRYRAFANEMVCPLVGGEDGKGSGGVEGGVSGVKVGGGKMGDNHTSTAGLKVTGGGMNRIAGKGKKGVVIPIPEEERAVFWGGGAGDGDGDGARIE